MLIRDGAQVHVIPVEKIDYVEAQDDYVCFKAEGRQYLKDQTMGALESQLDPARFVRIHRSYFLNIERIARVELYAKDSRVAILRDGTRLPVSRRATPAREGCSRPTTVGCNGNVAVTPPSRVRPSIHERGRLTRRRSHGRVFARFTERTKLRGHDAL